MPWVPTTDFEEEVVNLQPHHDFIYATLSEPVYSYPRPRAHMEYAANKKIQNTEQEKEYKKTGNMNGKLRAIQQVQLMAGTKPLGEQPCIEDWDNNQNSEQETIGMMRCCGMGASVEQPLNQKVTIASYPVDNTIKVVQNGRRKVALFFDDSVFKLQEKVSDSSSEFISCRNSKSNEISKNDPMASELEGDTSFDTSSSLSFNSFSTVEECTDSFSSVSSCRKMPLIYTKEQRLHQYDKLLEDTASLSLDSSGSHSSNTSRQQKSDSFKTAEETSFWKPISEDDENIFSYKKNWPSLSKEDFSSDINATSNNDVFNKTQSNSTKEISSEASSSSDKRESFLDRFIKSEDADALNATAKSTSTTSSQESTTYAAVAKAPKLDRQSFSNQKEKKDTSNLISDFPPFYTTRRMYALKRSVK